MQLFEVRISHKLGKLVLPTILRGHIVVILNNDVARKGEGNFVCLANVFLPRLVILRISIYRKLLYTCNYHDTYLFYSYHPVNPALQLALAAVS